MQPDVEETNPSLLINRTFRKTNGNVLIILIISKDYFLTLAFHNMKFDMA